MKAFVKNVAGRQSLSREKLLVDSHLLEKQDNRDWRKAVNRIAIQVLPLRFWRLTFYCLDTVKMRTRITEAFVGRDHPITTVIRSLTSI